MGHRHLVAGGVVFDLFADDAVDEKVSRFAKYRLAESSNSP
jgi:hypothetical protein